MEGISQVMSHLPNEIAHSVLDLMGTQRDMKKKNCLFQKERGQNAIYFQKMKPTKAGTQNGLPQKNLIGGAKIGHAAAIIYTTRGKEFYAAKRKTAS